MTTRWMIAATLLALTGCPSTTAYKPREGALKELESQDAETRLRETVGRAVEPPIVYVNVDDDALRYRHKEVVRGPFGIPTGSVERTKELFYVNVRRVELYENGWAYVYGIGNRLQAKLLFDTERDASSFADLLMSYRDQRVNGKRRPAAKPAGEKDPAAAQ